MNICLYHNADLDGYCSAAIWKQVYLAGELYGINYGQDIPWDRLRDQDVTLVDFSLQPWSEMERLFTEAKSVTWIDHHKSAYGEWEKAGRPDFHGELDTAKAACELTWEYYYPETDMPRGVFLLGDYDVWRHSDPDTMAYQMGMRLYDMDPGSNPACMEEWRCVFGGDTGHLEQTIREGRLLLAYQTQQNAKAVKAIWFPVQFAGKTWMAVNQGGISSAFWDSVWDDKYDGKLSFVRSRRHWTVSLYSDTVDCSEIALSQGGGGHKGASGFQCEELPFSFSYAAG